MSQVERNPSVDLFKRERGKRLRDGFRGLAPQKLIDYGVETDAAVNKILATVADFHVGRGHDAFILAELFANCLERLAHTAIRDSLARMRWLILLAASAASLFAQTAAPNDSGVAIGHIHMILGDPDAQKKLWVGVLGAEVTSAGALEMLKFPGVFIVLQKARTAPAEGSDGSTVNHFGFLVKSYAETKAKLTAAGGTFGATFNVGKVSRFARADPEKGVMLTR